MKFYLSSYKFGDKKDQLPIMAPTKRIAIIPNALDCRATDHQRTINSLANKKLRLTQLGFKPEVLDLKEYFNNKDELVKLIKDIGSVFMMGGNVSVLRQAMWLSGLDDIIVGLKDDPSFLYSGYSAGCCVLAPSLEPYKVVDDPDQHPYFEQAEVIWEGLGLVDFALMPHWQSDHPETEKIDKCIAYCEEWGIKYKAVRDGEVLIF